MKNNILAAIIFQKLEPSKIILALFVALSSGCTSIRTPSTFGQNSAYGTWETAPLTDPDGVVLIPQWHLSPQTNTRISNLEIPQAKNQTAIYQELSSWIESRDIQSFFVEGCEGNLRDQATVNYNGWSLNDLNNQKKDDSFDKIQTLIGNKIAAKYDGMVDVECADNLLLIKENQLALSDVRGLIGFKIRVEQETDGNGKFLKSLNSILKLPAQTKKETSLKVLHQELKKSLNKFEELIHLRNNSFISKMKSLKGRKVIVIGSLHIADLKTKLEGQKIPMAIWRPIGLNDSDANLIDNLRQTLDP